MEFDRVGRDPGLPVEEVPKGDSDDTRLCAEPYPTPRHLHLPLPNGCGPGGAEGRVGCLRDHLRAPASKDDVEVAVVLLADQRDRGGNAVDVPLERQASGRQEGWTAEADQVSDRRASRWQEARPVLERLHRPAFDPAGQCSRRLKVMRVRRSGDARGYRCAEHNEADENEPLVQ
jgi:hypothetical protein